MRRAAALLLLMLTGCSTAPIADLLDFFKPGHLEPSETPPYGGVYAPAAIGVPVAAPVVPAPALGAPAAAPVFVPPPPPPGPGPGSFPPPRPLEPSPFGPAPAAPMSNDLSRPASAPSVDGPPVLDIPGGR